MNIYPNTACAAYCTWILANSNIRVTTARKIQIETVQTAANTSSYVTQLYFEEFVAYTSQWYLQYQQYIAQQPAGGDVIVLDALTTAWLATVSNPSYTTVYAIDTFFKQCRADGNLAFDYFFVFAQDQQANARKSIINPTLYNITEQGNPTWTQYQGYTGNTSTMYLATNFTDSVNASQFTLNSGSFGYYTRLSIAAASKVCMGSYDGTYETILGSNLTTFGFITAVNNAIATYIPNSNTQGFFVANRVSSTSVQTFANGVQAGVATNTATGLSTKNDFIMCLNDNGTPFDLDNNQYVIAYKGSGAMNQSLLNTRVNTLVTNLGAHF